MTTDSWQGAVSGNWTTGTDWSESSPPQTGEDVEITAAGGPYTVTITNPINPINSLTIDYFQAAVTILDPGVTQTVTGGMFIDSGALAIDASGSGGSALEVGADLVTEPGGTIAIGNIVQCRAVAQVECFHIELDSHDVILAEGAAAETFVDCDSRQMFQNVAEFARLYPGEEPRRWAFRAPRVEDGEVLAALWARLAARAGLDLAPGALQGHLDEATRERVRGWARDAAHPDRPVLVEIVGDGRILGRTLANRRRPDLAASGYGHGRHGFDYALPAPLAPDRDHAVAARRCGDGMALAQSPRTVAEAWG
jgi:Hint domain